MTFTVKVTPSNTLNNNVEWKIVQQEEGSVEIVDGDEKTHNQRNKTRQKN